jgi:hypothetical protein
MVLTGKLGPLEKLATEAGLVDVVFDVAVDGGPRLVLVVVRLDRNRLRRLFPLRRPAFQHFRRKWIEGLLDLKQ